MDSMLSSGLVTRSWVGMSAAVGVGVRLGERSLAMVRGRD